MGRYNDVSEDLMSQDYIKTNNAAHKDPAYGAKGHMFAEMVIEICNKHGITEVLDYGCGKETLSQVVGKMSSQSIVVNGYDPALPGKDVEPIPHPFVACVDVLEHVEPALVENVIAHLHSKMLQTGIISVHTKAAKRILPDGRNAHLIIKDQDWWHLRIAEKFAIHTELAPANHVIFLVTPK